MEDVRNPVVAGTFYEKEPDRLRVQIEWCFKHPIGPGELPKKLNGSTRLSTGYISPHAGYVYSGPVAAHVFYNMSQEKQPETIIIIGPNHTGMGAPIALAPWKEWKTPLGKIKVDLHLRDLIIKKSTIIMPDYEAHSYEHSIEVQLPFIQYLYGDSVKILPIVAMDQSLESAQRVAEELIGFLDETGRDAIVIASTDFNHYEPHDVTVRKDRQAIQAIKSLEPSKFYQTIIEENVSVCGPFGVMVLMFMHKKRGGKPPILLKHATSGETGGDKSYTVGYVSAVFPL